MTTQFAYVGSSGLVFLKLFGITASSRAGLGQKIGPAIWLRPDQNWPKPAQIVKKLAQTWLKTVKNWAACLPVGR